MGNITMCSISSNSIKIQDRKTNIFSMVISLIEDLFLSNVSWHWLLGNVWTKTLCIWLEAIMKLDRLIWFMVSKAKLKPNSKIMEFTKLFHNSFVPCHLHMFSIKKLWFATEDFLQKIMSSYQTSNPLEDLLNLLSVELCAICCGQIRPQQMEELQVKEEPQWDLGLTLVSVSWKATIFVTYHLKLELLIRSHEVKQEGYEVHHNGQVVTIFSAPNYCDFTGNKGAFIRLKGN